MDAIHCMRERERERGGRRESARNVRDVCVCVSVYVYVCSNAGDRLIVCKGVKDECVCVCA